MGRRARNAVAAGAALLAALAAAGSAEAATVSSVDGVLSVKDQNDERNAVFVDRARAPGYEPDYVIVRDQDQPLTPGPGCVDAGLDQNNYESFHCDRPEHLTLDIDLGGGDDLVAVEIPHEGATIHGGPGSDQLDASAGGPVDYYGGDGFDIAGFGYADVPMTATIDDQPNDGAAGQGDNIHSDIEGLEGGFGDDHLYGTDKRDQIEGGLGDDVIEGGGGDDSLSGGQGADVVKGGPGADRLDGAEGPHYYAADTLDCGDGFDYVSLDDPDSEYDCENGFYPDGTFRGWSSQAPPGTPPPGWMPPFPPPPPLPVIAPDATLAAKKAIRLYAHCAGDAGTVCRGRVALERRQAVLGKATFKMQSGVKKTLRLRLNSRGRKVAARHHSFKVTAVVTPSGGKAQRTSVTVRRG